jgi:hypothetical protein
VIESKEPCPISFTEEERKANNEAFKVWEEGKAVELIHKEIGINPEGLVVDENDLNGAQRRNKERYGQICRKGETKRSADTAEAISGCDAGVGFAESWQATKLNDLDPILNVLKGPHISFEARRSLITIFTFNHPCSWLWSRDVIHNRRAHSFRLFPSRSFLVILARSPCLGWT